MSDENKKQQTTKQTITINGKEFVIDNLSPTVKSLLAVYNKWQQERQEAVQAFDEAKINVAKNEAAIRDLSKEIAELVESESAQSATSDTPKA